MFVCVCAWKWGIGAPGSFELLNVCRRREVSSGEDLAAGCLCVFVCLCVCMCGSVWVCACECGDVGWGGVGLEVFCIYCMKKKTGNLE